MRVLILHHTDLDGAASGAIVGMFYRNQQITYQLYNYGYPLDRTNFNNYDLVVAVDISFHETDPWIYEELKNKLIWIDHHKSAIEYESENPWMKEIKGLRRNGTAACELCWEYFYNSYSEAPKLIQYLGTYDVWNKNRFPWREVEEVEFGSKMVFGLSASDICDYLLLGNNDISKFIEKGKSILDYLERTFKSKIYHNGFYINDFSLPGSGRSYKMMVLNTLDFSSKSFMAYYDPVLFDIMMPFCIVPDEKVPGKLQVRVSFYTETPGVDCSEIAKYYLGGGHVGAAGALISLEELMKILNNSCTLKSYLDYLGIKK